MMYKLLTFVEASLQGITVVLTYADAALVIYKDILVIRPPLYPSKYMFCRQYPAPTHVHFIMYCK